MSLFRTLLWRESRDHRTWLVAACLSGPLLLALLSSLGGKTMTEEIAAMVLVPLLVLLFCAVLGAELFSHEASTGVAQTFERLPLSSTTVYFSKLTFLIAATVSFDAWLIAATSIRLAVAGESAGDFLRLAAAGAPGHVAALVIGIGSFALATWMKQSLPAVLASFVLFAGVPSLVFKLASIPTLTSLAGPASMWPVALWWGVVILALVLSGLAAVRLRGGVSFIALRRVGALSSTGLLLLALAGSASAGQWLFSNKVHKFHMADAGSGSFSPDGKYMAMAVVSKRPALGPSFGLWSDETQARMTTLDESSMGRAIWVYSLESELCIAKIDGYDGPEWTADGELEVSVVLPEGNTREKVTWDLASSSSTAPPEFEPIYAMGSHLTITRPDDSGQGFAVADEFGGREVQLGEVRGRYGRLHDNDGVLFVDAKGELILHDVSEGFPGESRRVAKLEPGCDFLIMVSAQNQEAYLAPTGQLEQGDARVAYFVNLETGQLEPDLISKNDLYFISWTYEHSPAQMPKRLYRSSPTTRGAEWSFQDPIFFVGPQGLVELQGAGGSIVFARPGGGFIVVNESYGTFGQRSVSEFYLVDEHGMRVSTLDSFGGF